MVFVEVLLFALLSDVDILKFSDICLIRSSVGRPPEFDKVACYYYNVVLIPEELFYSLVLPNAIEEPPPRLAIDILLLELWL